MRKTVIWGSGRYGDLAYKYYNEYFDISYYIDSNEEKHGSSLNGIEIVGPDWINNNECDVIVAIKTNGKEILDFLRGNANVGKVVIFGVNEKIVDISVDEANVSHIDGVVIQFGGGLGNQLFQYALYRALEIARVSVFVDISNYKKPGSTLLSVDKVFPAVKIKRISSEEKELFLKNLIEIDGQRKDYRVYEEGLVYDDRQKKFDLSLLNMRRGFVSGMFQTHIVADSIREELLKILLFNVKNNSKLWEIGRNLSIGEFTSLHVRRGDYLIKYYYDYYMNICTEKYYSEAINFIREKRPQTKFAFFSDDIKWVKDNFEINSDDVVVECSMFEEYYDWYDMYLMSCCKNNIIANSTFSWWGAWLNQNENKIVIAPKRWVNGCDYLDIYPENWVKM